MSFRKSQADSEIVLCKLRLPYVYAATMKVLGEPPKSTNNNQLAKTNKTNGTKRILITNSCWQTKIVRENIYNVVELIESSHLLVPCPFSLGTFLNIGDWLLYLFYSVLVNAAITEPAKNASENISL